ncbi:uncharacterized protein LOC121732619 isoform X2 [Aricia agestis]|uniref:uncharacterized protein LOC121732619 isoform X2 n=1 Tax=Aricia agestis TaxID=91739 RepID=UPI001C207D1D|nr:uncharacterized protein LOC121732619 isoform X2 [Aricia agestis]
MYYSVVAAVTSAHEISQLQVPLYADPRREAELSCHFRMDDQRLHSVKFYRDMYEIFRYNPSQTPPIRLFNVSGVAVQGGECLAASCAVRIMPPPLAGRAAYSCEVSTEGPKFKIARQTKHMTVVAMPDSDPVIVGAPKLVKPGEQVLLNCTTAFSLPPADINWFLDNELQKQEPWQRTELSPTQSGGLRASWRVLRLSVPPTASGTLRVRCEATLRVEPPVVREAVTTVTVYSRTQLSKYVSNRGTIFERGLKLCWTLLVILNFVSL